MSGYLLVRAGGVKYGLPLSHVVEVVDDATLLPLPVTGGAVRGVIDHRGTLVSAVHLDALLRRAAPPATFGGTVVVVRSLGRRVALEVDDALAVGRDAPLPVPRGRRFPWAMGLARVDGELVPVLDLDAAGERLAPAGARG